MVVRSRTIRPAKDHCLFEKRLRLPRYRACSHSSPQTKCSPFMNCRSVERFNCFYCRLGEEEALVISQEEAIALLKKWKDESAHIVVTAESPLRQTLHEMQE